MDSTNYGFFAMLDRMQYIGRWGLMRNSRTENIKEHSFDVAVIAQALAIIHNELIDNGLDGLKLDPYKVSSIALYHDCTEIITGDLPTPVKYKNKIIKEAYKEVERDAAITLTSLLPDNMKEIYLELLDPPYEGEEGRLVSRIVKASDRISAYIKCIREENAGNKEFIEAKESTRKLIDGMELPEVSIFMEKYVPSYGFTLDKINGNGRE